MRGHARAWLDRPVERKAADRKHWTNEFRAWDHIAQNMIAVYGPFGG